MLEVAVMNDFFRDTLVGLDNHGINRRWLAALTRARLAGIANVREICNDACASRPLDPALFYAALDLETEQGNWPKAYDAEGTPAFDVLVGDTFCGIDLVIGFGLPNSVARSLDRLGLPFLDFEVSPIRFMRRLAFDMRTNAGALDAAGYMTWKPPTPNLEALELMGRVARDAPDTLPQDAGRIGIVFGQTNIDAALIHNGRVATFSDFPAQIADWAADRHHVRFRPHPYAANSDQFHALRRILPDARPTLTGSYQLLSSNRVAKVMALSSGIVDEAPFFGIDATRMFTSPRRSAGYSYVMCIGLEALSPETVAAIVNKRALPAPVPASIDVRVQLNAAHGFGMAISAGDFYDPPSIDPVEPAETVPDPEDSMMREVQERLSDLEQSALHLTTAISALQDRIDKLVCGMDRLNQWARQSFWERLLFCKDGRPGLPVRRLMFHKNGKPRGAFRRLVVHADNRPHRPFARWMTSAEYQALPRAQRVSSAASPNVCDT